MEPKPIGKKELIELLAKGNHDLTKAKAGEIINDLTEIIRDAVLIDGTPVSLRGFGTFKAVTVQAHTARNPRTGEEVNVPAKRVVKFTAGIILKKYL